MTLSLKTPVIAFWCVYLTYKMQTFLTNVTVSCTICMFLTMMILPSDRAKHHCQSFTRITTYVKFFEIQNFWWLFWEEHFIHYAQAQTKRLSCLEKIIWSKCFSKAMASSAVYSFKNNSIIVRMEFLLFWWQPREGRQANYLICCVLSEFRTKHWNCSFFTIYDQMTGTTSSAWSPF